MNSTLRIAIVAGEASGDILGAGLIRELQQRLPDVSFEGIGGELMIEQGVDSLYPLERLSVMGLVEVLGRLRELLGIRKSLVQRWIDNPPDLFIGIDAPDFNLTLEAKLKAAGIPTVHYVSPSVWAWRKKRVEKIKRSTDLMLTLFPFEAAFYRDNAQRVNFVGHTLANTIRGDESQQAARHSLGLNAESTVVALMPGSRGGELKHLAQPFLETAAWLAEQRDDIQFVLPAANEKRFEQLEQFISDGFTHLDIKLIMQDSRLALTASDTVLIASGTATLEALLSRRPMTVAYKMAPLTFSILSRLVKSPSVSLPNLLANERLVPEVLQDDVCADVLGPLVLSSLDDEDRRHYLEDRFSDIHRQLAMNADSKAADAVMALLYDTQS